MSMSQTDTQADTQTDIGTANGGRDRDAATESGSRAEVRDGGTADADREPDAVTERLLQAAVDVFVDHGFEAARVAEIARRAGLTTGAIYARWPGKRELIIEAVSRSVAGLLQPSKEASDEDASEFLSDIGTSLVGTQHARVRDLMVEALVTARRDDSFRGTAEQMMQEEAATLAALVSKAKSEGAIDSDLSTVAIVALYQGLGLGMRLVLTSAPEDLELPAGEWSALIERLVAAVAPPTA